jgi:hypothetical protein
MTTLLHVSDHLDHYEEAPLIVQERPLDNGPDGPKHVEK